VGKISCVLLLVAGLVACSSSTEPTASGGGGGGDGEGGGGGGEGSAGTCKVTPACSLMSADDVSKTLGRTYGAGVENDLNTKPSASAAAVLSCTYSGAGTDPAVSINFRCCPCGDNNPTTVKAAAGSAAITDVSGVGDSAFHFAKSAGALTSHTLFVFVGKNTLVQITITSATAAAPPDPIAATKTLAAAALARL
jgi:hypothetical protein